MVMGRVFIFYVNLRIIYLYLQERRYLKEQRAQSKFLFSYGESNPWYMPLIPARYAVCMDSSFGK
jgi:hypothetical protein